MPKKPYKWQHGDPIPFSLCPTCGAAMTYNGNYYCVNFDEALCDYAVPHPTTRTDDLNVLRLCYLLLARVYPSFEVTDEILRDAASPF